MEIKQKETEQKKEALNRSAALARLNILFFLKRFYFWRRFWLNFSLFLRKKRLLRLLKLKRRLRARLRRREEDDDEALQEMEAEISQKIAPPENNMPLPFPHFLIPRADNESECEASKKAKEDELAFRKFITPSYQPKEFRIRKMKRDQLQFLEKSNYRKIKESINIHWKNNPF